MTVECTFKNLTPNQMGIFIIFVQFVNVLNTKIYFALSETAFRMQLLNL